VFERFTQPARRVVALAEEEADRLRHGYIGPEHLLLGIVRHGDSGAAGVLRAHGLDLAAARVEVGRLVDQGVLPRPERSDAEALRGDPRPSRRARRTRAYLGLPGPGASPVGRVVQGCGLTLEQLRAAVLAQLHAAT